MWQHTLQIVSPETYPSSENSAAIIVDLLLRYSVCGDLEKFQSYTADNFCNRKIQHQVWRSNAFLKLPAKSKVDIQCRFVVITTLLLSSSGSVHCLVLIAEIQFV